MAIPNVRVYMDLSAGLEYNAASAVDITNSVARVNVSRGRTRLLNDFEAGTATITFWDDNGDFNPDNTSSPYYPNLQINKKIKITAKPFATEYPIYMGYITKFDTKFNQANDTISQVSFECTDAYRLLQSANITTVTGGTAQLSGTRIGKILDAISFPPTMRDLDPGVTTCQADSGSSRTALEAIRTVEKTEGGAFFVDRSGKAAFVDRDALYNSLYKASPLVTPRFVDFTVDISTYRDVQYQQAVVRLDDDLIYNDVTTQRVGGVAQNKQDASSITSYSKRSASRTGLLMQTDAEASDLAAVLLATLKDPETRIDQVSIDITQVTNTQASRSMDFELMAVVYAIKTMPDGSVLYVNGNMIQGINYDFSPNRSIVTFYVGEPLIKGLILNDDTYGTLDYNYLGY